MAFQGSGCLETTRVSKFLSQNRFDARKKGPEKLGVGPRKRESRYIGDQGEKAVMYLATRRKNISMV